MGYLKIVQKLQQQCINVNCERTNSTSRSLFFENSKDISTNDYSKLKEEIPELEGKQFVYDANKFYCSGSDIVITLTGKK